MNQELKKKIIYYSIESLYILSNIFYVLYLFLIFDLKPIEYNFNISVLVLLIIFISSVLIFTGPILSNIVSLIIFIPFTIYVVCQNIYYNEFEQYIRIGPSIALLKEAKGVSGSIVELLKFEYVIPFIIITAINIIFIFLYFKYQRKVLSIKSYIIAQVIKVAICLIMLAGFNAIRLNLNSRIIALNYNEENINELKDYYLYTKIDSSTNFVKKFGLLTYLYRDLTTLNSNLSVSEKDILYYENFMLEKDKILFKNKYSSIFKGKDVLFVQAESFMNLAIDMHLTPTLFKIKNNSINVQGYSNPLLPNSTADCEFMNFTSFIPNSDEVAVCYEYENNSYKTTLAGIFNDSGYNSLLMHNMFSQFYNRINTYTNFKFNQFKTLETYNIDEEVDDLDFSQYITEQLLEDEKKMIYWITYSGHQPYNYESIGVSLKDVETIHKYYPNLDENYTSYFAKTMNLDKALENIIHEYSLNKNLDDLVIIFFGDHIAKGLDLSESSNFYKQTNKTYSKQLFNTELYIYNTGINPQSYKKISFAIDMIPTVANLFELNLDNRTILGQDIFDSKYNGFRFDSRQNIYTNNYTYYKDIEKVELINTDIKDSIVYDELYKYSQYRDLSKIMIKSNIYRE